MKNKNLFPETVFNFYNFSDNFCTVNGAGVHADPDTCKGYIMCDMAGIKHKRPCPGNLLFNATLGVCDWPQNVNCKKGSGANSFSKQQIMPLK